MIFEFLAAADLWTTVKDGIPVVLALVVIEGLLSVDNALAIAAMAKHLDEKKRTLAMNIGYIGAYGFRVVALLVASVIPLSRDLRCTSLTGETGTAAVSRSDSRGSGMMATRPSRSVAEAWACRGKSSEPVAREVPVFGS